MLKNFQETNVDFIEYDPKLKEQIEISVVRNNIKKTRTSLRDVELGLTVLRHPAVHRARPGVVGGDGEVDPAGALELLREVARPRVDGLLGVEGVVDAQHRGRAGHELRGAHRAGERDAVRAVARLDGDDGAHEAGGQPMLPLGGRRERRQLAVARQQAQRAVARIGLQRLPLLLHEEGREREDHRVAEEGDRRVQREQRRAHHDHQLLPEAQAPEESEEELHEPPHGSR